MKKLMITIAVIAAMTSSAFAAEDKANPTEEQARSAIESYVNGYATNGFWHSSIGKSLTSITNYCTSNLTFKSETEAILVAKPCVGLLNKAVKDTFPSATEATLNYLDTDYPVLTGWYRANDKVAWSKDASDEKRIQLNLESFAVYSCPGTMGWFDRVRVRILRACTRSVRRKLREEGKPIAGDAGNALVQERIDAVTAALDAPRFAGLKTAIAACGVKVKVPDAYPGALDDAALTNCMDEVYFGEVHFTENKQVQLRFNLGLKSYNDFVDRYNNGK